VRPGKQEVAHDFPNNGWRMRAIAEGIEYTVVNGEVLVEHGKYTEATPGRVVRNAHYHAVQNGGN
jgi:N-acyl-D-aspartate/D-glutamate deacylase